MDDLGTVGSQSHEEVQGRSQDLLGQLLTLRVRPWKLYNQPTDIIFIRAPPCRPLIYKGALLYTGELL